MVPLLLPPQPEARKQNAWVAVRQLETIFSHGRQWNRLISAYMTTISPSGDTFAATEQNM
jgi:hypothetical protein